MGLFSRGDKVDPDELSDVRLFSGLADDEIAAIASMANRREVAAGERLLEQGRFGDSFFILASGTAGVYIAEDYVATVGQNSAVGEMALLERRPRNATVIAQTAMVVAEFSVKDFNKLLDSYPSANLRINELLNRRLAENMAKAEEEDSE